MRLLNDVSAKESAEVLDHLASLGITASFERDKPQAAAPEPEDGLPEPQMRQEAAEATTGKRGRTWWIRQSLAVGLIVCGAVFMLWMFNPVLATSLLPFLPAQSGAPKSAVNAAASAPLLHSKHEATSRFREPKEAKLKTATLPQVLPVNQGCPGLLQVPPEQIYDTFLLRYRLKPDVRFAMALRYLLHTRHDANNRLEMGRMLWSAEMLKIPLLKNNTQISELQVTLPLTFPRMLEALDNWMRLLEAQGYSFALSDTPVLELPYTSAMVSISQVDQRRILNGLASLDQQWRTGGPNRTLLQAAICGHVLLQVTMRPDPLQRADNIAGDTLGMLALARHGKPAAATAVETFLVARTMGYDGFASGLELPEDAAKPPAARSLLLAYVREDLGRLETLHDQDPSTLSRYLLARLYAGAGNKARALELYTNISREQPYGFPWTSESFNVNTLNASKQTTLAYPMLLLYQVVPPQGNSPAKEALMKDCTRLVSGEKPEQVKKDGQPGVSPGADISFEAFDKYLAQWQPFKDTEASGFFMDNDKARLVMRALYESAMEQRFKLLFHNWNVVEIAHAFSSSLLGKDKQHRLAKHYLAQTLIRMGKSGEALRYAVESFNDRQASGGFVYDAYEILQQLKKAEGMGKGVACKLDSRPEYQAFLGNVFYYQRNPNMAAAFYQKLSKTVGDQLWLQKNLRVVTKSDAPLLEYAAAHPDDCDIQSAVGKYFTDKKTGQGFAKALEYYSRATALRPDDPWLQMYKAWCLRKVGRCDEAIAILKDAVSLYPGRDLTYTELVTCLAKAYLDKGDAAQAVETIRDEIASYKNDTLVTGAKAYEQAGDLGKAEELYIRSVERYPSSAYSQSNLVKFYWKQGDYAEAAAVVKKGRALGAMRYDWFFEPFVAVFKDQPPEKGFEAYKAFADASRPSWETDRLAKELDKNGLHQLAYDVAALHMPVNPHSVAIRYILLNTIGRTLPNPPETMEVFHDLIRSDYRKDRLQNMLMTEGEYSLTLEIYKNPEEFDNNVRHAIMLNNLICWLRLDKQPPELEQEFVTFFQQERDSYMMLPGRLLLGMLDRAAFLKASDTRSKRAMACYYIGLQERLQGNFDKAAIWYQICRETRGRVYETGFAVAELRRWFEVGTSNLAKLNKADVLRVSAAD